MASLCSTTTTHPVAQGPGFVNEDTDGFSYGSSELKLAVEEMVLALRAG